MKKIKCPYCGHKSPVTEERCEECGGPLPEQESPQQKVIEQNTSGAKKRKPVLALAIAGVFSLVFILCIVLTAAPFILSLVSGSSESASADVILQESQSASLSASVPETEPESQTAAETGKDPFMPPYSSYDAADYALPEEQAFDMEGTGEKEREGAWYQALHCDTVICEMTLENLQDTELTLYSSDIKVTVDEGAYTISRPPMEVIHDSAPHRKQLSPWPPVKNGTL